MGQTAEETRKALLAAMHQYRLTVLNERHFDEATGLYKYPYRIAKSEVLRLAGIKSRSTLKNEYHAKLEGELDALIKTLKEKTGKLKPKDEADDSDPVDVRQSTESASSRLESLAQTIIAQRYKILALEQELAASKSGNSRGQVSTLPNGPRRPRQSAE